MNAETPLALHRQRLTALSNTLGAWMECGNASCRRKGACRRADDIFPPCLLPIVRDVGECVFAYAAPLAGLPPRAAPQEGSLGAQINRVSRRVANILEAQAERMERAMEKKRTG